MEPVEVYVAMDPIEAAAAAGVLQAAGISAHVRDMGISAYPVTIGPLGEKRVAVAAEDAEPARCALRRAVEDGILAGRILTSE
ncbi:MAG: DUF2007 domain-containing protein [Deltaproteobacteria bacterium]|nr:DUF2007 domain-containing protein [Deltaproteobacteria bacterium]